MQLKLFLPYDIVLKQGEFSEFAYFVKLGSVVEFEESEDFYYWNNHEV